MLNASVFAVLTMSIVLILRRVQTSKSEPTVKVESQHELQCPAAVAFDLLQDLRNWQYWFFGVQSDFRSSCDDGLGQLLQGSLDGHAISLEILQAWTDRRLLVVTFDLSRSIVRHDQLDFYPAGAFCNMTWKTAVDRMHGRQSESWNNYRKQSVRNQSISNFRRWLDEQAIVRNSI